MVYRTETRALMLACRLMWHVAFGFLDILHSTITVVKSTQKCQSKMTRVAVSKDYI